MGSFTKTECFQEQNCLFFKSLEGFYSLQPAPLDTLEKPDLKVFTKMKSFSFLKYSSAREDNNENGKELCQITPSGWDSQGVGMSPVAVRAGPDFENVHCTPPWGLPCTSY